MIKTTQKRVNIGDSDGKMAALFNQLLGTGDINMTIAYPRYIRIKDYCTKLVSLFEIIAKSPYMRYTDSRAEILSFCVRGSARIQALFYMDFTAYEWNLSTVDEELQKRFVANYKEVKSCDIINTFITMLAALAPYRKSFENINQLSSRFLTGMSGVEWRPFPFTSLNMKAIFDDPDAKANTRDCFMSLLHKSYDFARLLHTELSSPDVDVEQFSVAIIESIEKLKKRPELQRCDQAFAKIKESIGMLKGNFNKYYADFVDTKDSTIMMQNFVADVASSTKANSAVTYQFRKIIGYYSKMAREQPKDESTNMLFQKVDAAFGQMGKNSMPDAVDLAEDPDSAEICVFDASAKSLSEVLAPVPEPKLSRVSAKAPAGKPVVKPAIKKPPAAKKIQVSKLQKTPRGGNTPGTANASKTPESTVKLPTVVIAPESTITSAVTSAVTSEIGHDESLGHSILSDKSEYREPLCDENLGTGFSILPNESEYRVHPDNSRPLNDDDDLSSIGMTMRGTIPGGGIVLEISDPATLYQVVEHGVMGELATIFGVTDHLSAAVPDASRRVGISECQDPGASKDASKDTK